MKIKINQNVVTIFWAIVIIGSLLSMFGYAVYLSVTEPAKNYSFQGVYCSDQQCSGDAKKISDDTSEKACPATYRVETGSSFFFVPVGKVYVQENIPEYSDYFLKAGTCQIKKKSK
jgi:hypothetical protein